MSVTLIARRKTKKAIDILKLKVKSSDIDVEKIFKEYGEDLNIENLTEEDSQRAALRKTLKVINHDEIKSHDKEEHLVLMFRDFLTETIKNKLSIFQLSKKDKDSSKFMVMK